MITFWPSCLPASSASVRRWRSVEPDGGHGQISVIARLGNFSCASSGLAGDSQAAAAPACCSTLRGVGRGVNELISGSKGDAASSPARAPQPSGSFRMTCV